MLLLWSIETVIWRFPVLLPFSVELTRQMYLNIYPFIDFLGQTSCPLFPLKSLPLFARWNSASLLIKQGISGTDPCYNLMQPLNLSVSLRDSICHINDPCISVLARHCQSLSNYGTIFFPIRETSIIFLYFD